MKKILTFICVMHSFGFSAFACGCTDSTLAATAATGVISKYTIADQSMAKSLAALGESIKSGYQSMGNGALDLERILRLQKEDALIERQIAFERDKKVLLRSNANVIEIKNAEIDLGRAEKSSILKSTTTNK